MWNWKWWSLFLHVHAYIAVHPSNTPNVYLIYACTCKKRVHHFQFHLKSVIMSRFQSFLVFWKAKGQLFHLNTSPFKRELVSLSEKQHLRKNHDFFTKMPSWHLAKKQYFVLKCWWYGKVRAGPPLDLVCLTYQPEPTFCLIKKMKIQQFSLVFTKNDKKSKTVSGWYFDQF